MKHIKKAAVLFGICAWTAALSFPSLATEKIEDITMEIWSNIRAGDSGSDVEVEVDNEGCYVESVTVTNEPDEWEEDDKPKVKIILEAEDDYSFSSSLGKDDVALDEDEGTVTSVSRSSSKKLNIYVTLVRLDEAEYDDEDDEDYDLDVYDLVWDEGDRAAAYWDECDYAKRYEVRLYRDGEAVSEVLTTENGGYNFASYFTKGGDYTFRARAVRSESNKSSWRESDSITVSDSEASEIYKNRADKSGGSSGVSSDPTEGAWLQDQVGYWWCNPDKTYPVSVWKRINQNWYYFNAGGYRTQNAWVQTNERWYYCGPNGVMQVNDWVQTDGKWYYCGADGAMLTNQEVPGGYWVNADGVWEQ